MAVAFSRPRSQPTVLSPGDRLALLVRVVLPTWGKGLMLRRRSFARLAAVLDLDAHAVRFMQYLRRKYGEGPVLVRVAGRKYAILLRATDVKEALHRSPCPLSPASQEKVAALAHFEPHASLITKAPERQQRRAFNDKVLESGSRHHSLAACFVDAVRDEASAMISSIDTDGGLTWPAFTEAWFRSVRRIVLGERARSDRGITEDLAHLRARANWVRLRTINKQRRDRYHQRLAGYLCSPEDGTLAQLARNCARDEVAEKICDQITHWLFAFDAGGITTFRALSLFASHPPELKRARSDLLAWRSGQIELPYLSAGFLEAVRLWPTTPVILRETIQPTTCGDLALEPGSGVVIYAPFFHRDDERLAYASRFTPDLWLGRDPGEASPFVPFSAGPARCPGRHLVTLIGAAWLAAMLDAGRVELTLPHPHRERALPGTLDHFTLRFRLLDRTC